MRIADNWPMCDEEQEIKYRTIPYECGCAAGYDLQLAVHPFNRPAAGEHDFVCHCGLRYTQRNPAGLAGSVVSFRRK